MNEDSLPLNRLKEGSRAKILRLASEKSMRKRFMDMGLIEGTFVECLHKSPAGNPAAYLIRGAVIAIRNEDADEILVSVLQ